MAPDVETRITCAIAEIGQRAYNALGISLFVGVIFMVAPGRGVQTSGETSSFEYLLYSLFSNRLHLLAVSLILLMRSPIHGKSDFDKPTYQSGIPQQLTQISRALFLAVLLLVTCFLVCLVLFLIEYACFKNIYFAELLGLIIVFAISSHAAAVIERVRWVLELRAEQGHVLDFGEEGEEADTGSRIPWYRRAT